MKKDPFTRIIVRYVIEASDYYPFGKRIPSPVTESAVTEPVEVTGVQIYIIIPIRQIGCP